MTGGTRRLGAVLATAALIAVLGLALLALAPTAAADSHANDSSPYAVEQGDQCVDVNPIVDENQNVSEFYDYRHPNSTPSESTFSSYGTTAYQEDDTSTLLVYDGAEGTSLVFIHERLHEPSSQGTNGSSVTMTVTGIDPGDGWAVEDDDYDGQNDEFAHGESQSVMTWLWTQGRNDGGAYRGLEGDVEIGIEPAFNEDAEKRFDNTPGYSGQITDWDVVTATEDGHDRVELGNLEESVTVRSGHCAAPPNASLDVDETAPEVGSTSVDLDAGDASAAAGVDEYRWDLNGNGSAGVVTDDSGLDHVFETPGEREVSVTVVDEHGRTDTASVAVDVTDDAAPTASIDARSEAVVGEEIELSGADSDDNHRIASYQWTLGDGNTRDGDATLSHAYDAQGEYEVELVVTDPAGNEDATTTNVTVTEPTGPVAALDAPANATVGDPVALDAGGSIVGENDSYEWRVDGTTVNTTTEPTYDHTFSSADTRTVSVVASDENGSDPAEATVDVAEQLSASADANRTTVAAGEPIRFDASGSTGRIAGYQWAFGDGTDTDGDVTATHTYDESGEYTAELVVRDGAGDTATAEVAVEVVDPAGPTASLDVPANATTGEPVRLDAGESEVGENPTYEWTVDGATVNATTEPTYDHTFSATGEFDVGVTVTDDGETDTAEATVSVETAGGNGTDGGNDGDSGNDGGDSDDGNDDTDDSSGGGYAGGSGGYGSSPSSPSEPVEATAEVTDGAVVVTAEHVDAGEAFTVEPSTADATGFDEVDLRSIEIVTAEDAESATIAFEPVARDVPGRFARSPAVVPDTSTEIESVTYEFAVDRELLGTAGISADDVTAYAHEGSDDWTSVETTAEIAGSDEQDSGEGSGSDRSGGVTVLASATASGDTPVGVGAVGPTLYVGDVETVGPVQNGTIDVAATVRNTGSEPGEWEVPIEVGDGSVTQATVSLDAGEETAVEASAPAAGASDSGVRVAGARRALAVVETTDLAIESTLVEPEEGIVANATVVNRGDAAGEYEAELRRDGDVVATEPVALEPGERETVTFEQRIGTTGTYRFAVGNASAEVRVAQRDDFDDSEGNSSEDGDGTAGFGALAALVAVALVALVGVGRRRR